MTARVRRLPVVPLAQPIQLVLGLDGIGIERPRKRRHAKAPHPWLPVAKVAAA